MKIDTSPVLRFYIDDSGSRDPDRSRSSHPAQTDWFGMGGILVLEQDLAAFEQQVTAFRQRWPHPEKPLHSYEIRMRKQGFAWLKTSSAAKQTRFMDELSSLMGSLPMVVHAAVVDRPGYNRRYLEAYGPRRWSLCRTAFKIAVERAAKYARSMDARLRVFVEQSDRQNELRLRTYFDNLRSVGLPFDPGTSAKYKPLDPQALARTLYEFRVKSKASIPMQIADLALWPVCKSKYQPDNRSFAALHAAGRLLDTRCTTENGLHGIKYSCFD